MKRKTFIVKIVTLLLSIIFIAILFLFGGCTKNARTRTFGGTEELGLKTNERLINVTWKESNLWVLTEDTITHIKYFRVKADLEHLMKIYTGGKKLIYIK